MTTIRDMPLDCPEATYVEPVYKEAGMRNFTNLVRTMLNDYGVYHVQFNTINKQTLIDAKADGMIPVLVTDCISSRKETDKEYAIERAKQEGAIVTTYEADIAERVQDDIINRTEHTF